MDMETRRSRYAKVSTAFAHYDDATLRDLFREDTGSGWGTTKMIEIAGEKSFLKAIPLTDLEIQHGFSTSNLFDLPIYYQYGVGSAGFGAWRELIASITTSNWVLAGATEAFALLYHWRVIERPATQGPSDDSAFDRYIQYWNSSEAIGRYAREREAATHALVLCLEWFPCSLEDHLARNPDDIKPMIDQLCDAVTFLHDHGIFHFDTHFLNVVTDGERPYLVDFGLASDEKFDLTEIEQNFLRDHTHYDYGEVIYSLEIVIVQWCKSLPQAQQEDVRSRLGVDDDPASITKALVAKAECLDGLVHPTLLDAIVRYRPVIQFMAQFFAEQRANHRKDTPFDDARLRQLLVEADVIG